MDFKERPYECDSCFDEYGNYREREPDMSDHNEFYVDDCAIVSRDPATICDALKTKNMFTLKGTGSIRYHLVCDFFREDDGYLCYAPKKYIDFLIIPKECIIPFDE
jgi:hypothetical protein